MNEIAEHGKAYVISETQKRAIIGIADIRRGQQTLSAELDVLGQRNKEVAEPVRDVYDSQVRLIIGIMNGAEHSDDKPKEESISSSLRKASQFADTAPNLAALYFAKAAVLQQEASLPYDETVANAKEALKEAQAQGIQRTTPADYLPDAYILRIAKKATDGVTLPSPQTFARYMQEEPSLLEDYALVLPEDQREDFVASFPEDKRHEVSVRLDRSVSSVLSDKLVTEPEQLAQRDAIKERVREAFAHSLDKLKPTRNDEGKDFGGRALGSRWSSKELAQTLLNLDEKDSLQLLRDLSSQTTRELKAANKAKHLKRASFDEKQKALQPFLSFTGRVLHTLVETDTKRGGTLTMRYLETTALPDRFFTFFGHKLVDQGYFSSYLTPFLKESENTPVLKKLMAQYGSQFNTIVDTLAKTSDYCGDHKLAPRKEELFEALQDLGTLTPRIFESYRRKSPEERKAFAEKIRELKPKFFQNMPIKQILDGEDREILTEMVYVAYKPQGMSFEQVDKLIRQIDDHTDDLAGYTFPEEGYDLNLERSGGYVLKEGQKANLAMLRRYKHMFTGSLEDEEKEHATPFADALREYLEQQSQGEEGRPEIRNPEVMRILLAPLGIRLKRELTTENAYNTTSELAEIAGHDFDAYYSRAITEYLKGHPEEYKAIFSLVHDNQDEMQGRIRNPQFDWEDLPDEDISRRLDWEGSKRICEVIRHEQIEPLRIQLESEMSKYTVARPDKNQTIRSNLRAYVSKNVGSFFAKAAAGICTSKDISLFERHDHFHINVVESDETVRANNQAYIDTVDGKPSLILRGFNPTADWVGKIDVESYCEEILRVGKQFAAENDLVGGVYITDQDDGWHALSNREQPARYLEGKYVDGKEAVKHDLQVSDTGGGHTVDKIYKI